jgi:hypothetical protein
MPLGLFIFGLIVLVSVIVALSLYVHVWPHEHKQIRDDQVLKALTKQLFKDRDVVIFVPNSELPWNEHDVPQVRPSHRHENGVRVEGSEIRLH